MPAIWPGSRSHPAGIEEPSGQGANPPFRARSEFRFDFACVRAIAARTRTGITRLRPRSSRRRHCPSFNPFSNAIPIGERGLWRRDHATGFAGPDLYRRGSGQTETLGASQQMLDRGGMPSRSASWCAFAHGFELRGNLVECAIRRGRLDAGDGSALQPLDRPGGCLPTVQDPHDIPPRLVGAHLPLGGQPNCLAQGQVVVDDHGQDGQRRDSACGGWQLGRRTAMSKCLGLVQLSPQVRYYVHNPNGCVCGSSAQRPPDSVVCPAVAGRLSDARCRGLHAVCVWRSGHRRVGQDCRRRPRTRAASRPD